MEPLNMILYLVLGLGIIWIIAIIVFDAYFSARKKYIEECLTLLTRDTDRGKDSKKIQISSQGYSNSKS